MTIQTYFSETYFFSRVLRERKHNYETVNTNITFIPIKGLHTIQLNVENIFNYPKQVLKFNEI